MHTVESESQFATTKTQVITTDSVEYFGYLLEQEAITFREVEYYLQAGDPTWQHGWIIHLSVINRQIGSLLKEIVPILKSINVAFRVAKDSETAKSILNGNIGLVQLGKVLSIYSESDSQALAIAQTLIPITQTFKGPDILTDRHLGGTVYVRYGNISPITKGIDKDGHETYYYENSTQESPCQYSIPFELPAGISWPFDAITSLYTPQEDKLLESKIKTIGVLKQDARGNVLQGIWMERWWKIKKCVIKEGKYAMVTDDAGRDIQDRLDWQYKLHNALYGKIPIPKAYAYLKGGRDHYLVIESIQGRSLDIVIKDIYADSPWMDLNQNNQLMLIRFASQVLSIIQSYHDNGYVHRDINPGNFLVKKNGELVLIDLELSYSLEQKTPTPPFRYGTSWFMSPEQRLVETPTVKEDIYAVGATLLCLFTGLLPGKFATEDFGIGVEQLQFFIHQDSLSKNILACFKDDPEERPSLTDLKVAIENFKEYLQSQRTTAFKKELCLPAPEEIQEILQDSIASLASSIFTSKNALWFSKTIQQPDFSYYQLDECSIYPGLGIGVSGVASLLSDLHRSNFSIRRCMSSFQATVSYILNADILQREVGYGLYTGSAGISMSLSNTLDTGLVKEWEEVQEKIISHLKKSILDNYSIASGTAGQVIAALKCYNSSKDPELLKIIEDDIHQIQLAQQADGSWITWTGKHHQKVLGFSHGVAGIIYSLLCYAEYSKDETVSSATLNGLEWLMKCAYKKGNLYRWPYSDRNKEIYPGFSDGFAGIAVTFIKAYQVFKDNRYKQVAEGILQNFPPRLSVRDLSFTSGGTGVGEVYLEAFKTFNDNRWKERADWIVAFLLHQCKRKTDEGSHWIIDESPSSTADLLTGNSGVIYFLLRNLTEQHIAHPLLV